MPELVHIMPEKPSDFDFGFFSMAFQMKQAMRGDTDAAAARHMGFMPATIRRIERGDALLIGVILTVCKYIEMHPFGYLSVSETPSRPIEKPKPARVSRETLAPIEPSPLHILLKTRAKTQRQVDMLGKALERLEGKKDYADVFTRHQRYLAALAEQTLAIEAVRLLEGKEVKVFGSLGAV
jgi:hypothetical protein